MRDVVIPSSQLAAYYAGITEEMGAWRCLKKHGLAFVSNLVETTEEQKKFLHHAMSTWQWTDELFTRFDEVTKDEVFLHDRECNRWVTTDREKLKFVTQWNNLENSISQWLNSRSNFPLNGQPWKLTFSAFKSSKMLLHPQSFHLDVGPTAYC